LPLTWRLPSVPLLSLCLYLVELLEVWLDEWQLDGVELLEHVVVEVRDEVQVARPAAERLHLQSEAREGGLVGGKQGREEGGREGGSGREGGVVQGGKGGGWKGARVV
jgi:hypothetical protein